MCLVYLLAEVDLILPYQMPTPDDQRLQILWRLSENNTKPHGSQVGIDFTQSDLSLHMVLGTQTKREQRLHICHLDSYKWLQNESSAFLEYE